MRQKYKGIKVVIKINTKKYTIIFALYKNNSYLCSAIMGVLQKTRLSRLCLTHPFKIASPANHLHIRRAIFFDIRGSNSAVLFVLTRRYIKRLSHEGYTSRCKNLRCPSHDNRCPCNRKEAFGGEWKRVISSFFGFIRRRITSNRGCW